MIKPKGLIAIKPINVLRVFVTTDSVESSHFTRIVALTIYSLVYTLIRTIK